MLVRCVNRQHFGRSSSPFRDLGRQEILDGPGAGERIRTVDLRITSASSEDLTQTAESPEAQNPCNIETSEPEGKPEDP